MALSWACHGAVMLLFLADRPLLTLQWQSCTDGLCHGAVLHLSWPLSWIISHDDAGLPSRFPEGTQGATQSVSSGTMPGL